MFFRYSLRTTDPVAAREFYSDALGLVIPDGLSSTGSTLDSWLLHEQAIARGAVAHWLGQLAVDDVEATVARLVGAGSERLGPTQQSRDGTAYAVLRDPFGAVIAVRTRAGNANESPVVWHQLHTRDADGSWALYHELLGWVHKQTVDVPDPVGGFRLFAWNETGKLVGGLGNTARWPGVHAHWLFCFPVADIEASAARVDALGGDAMEPVELPDGTRLVGCEDPQGAAFGLAQRPAR